MELLLIAALAQNGVIGRDGDLPWRLPDDLKHFKRRTLGHPVVMGRRTWESLRRALPGRLNLVLSRRDGYLAEGASVVGSLAEALELAREAETGACFVIGGASLYAEALPRADALVLTHVEAVVPGDVLMPTFDRDAWEVVSEEPHPADERHAHAFTVREYRRRQ